MFRLILTVMVLVVNAQFFMLWAQDTPKRTIKLRSHEDNLVGYRKDDNDVAFLDFKLSLMYPMLHDGEPNGSKGKASMWGPIPYGYFAFTGEFGQYIGTRSSSPVIAKKFNPKIFGRYWLSQEGSYLDFSYEHESNGQSIDTASAYQRKRLDLIASGEDPDFAIDYISRGWDFLGATLHKELNFMNATFGSTFKAKYFLDDGLLQQAKEEPQSWEGTTEDHHRGKYDGLSVKLETKVKFKFGPIRGSKGAFYLTTGYLRPLEKISTRVEFLTQWWDFPLVLWGANGFNNDLADYYERVGSYGVAFELKSFDFL
jgi:hypothetical protein